MKTILQQLDQAFRQAISGAFGFEADPVITTSQNERFGDYQSNAAMGLVRQIAQETGPKTNPRAVAELIKAKLDLGEMAEEISIAGPGFINVRLSPRWLAGRLQQAGQDERLGVEPAPRTQRVVVDYSGPNIAKEMHVGHLRSTIIGDSFVRTLAFLGHDVIRQNHIGDWGLQMGMVTYAVEHHAEDLERLTLADLERLYRQISEASKDPALRRQMAERTRDLQQTPKQRLDGWRKVRELTLASAQQIYRRLGVTLAESDVRGESFYSDQYEPLVRELRQQGVAVETEGAVGIFPPGFVNREGQPRPFIIQSRDGSFQYPTFDLAALRFRVRDLRAQRIIYTHDARQAEHFAMLFAVAGMLGLDRINGEPVQFDYAAFGTILGEDGKPLKSREGENIKLHELLDEAEQRALDLVNQKSPDLPEAQRRSIAAAVGIGAIKYYDLARDRTGDYIFSWDKMLAMDGNTGPYLQYAYARIRSIFRKAEGSGLRVQGSEVRLETEHELVLAKHILRLGEVIEQSARELRPHFLCNYLYELATKFSGFYENCPVLQSNEPTRSSRLLLCDLTGRTLARGLELLGIDHPEQM